MEDAHLRSQSKDVGVILLPGKEGAWNARKNEDVNFIFMNTTAYLTL